MKSNIMTPNHRSSASIRITASCTPISAHVKPAPDVPFPLPPEVANAVCLQPTLNGGLCLAEVVSFDGLIVKFREFRQVGSFADAVAMSAELKRPLLESLQIRSILERSRHEKVSSKPGLGIALAEPPKGAVKEAPAIADTLPAEVKEWCLFSIKDDRELEAQGLTLTDALNLQLAEIHTGASWTAVYRTHKTFVVYNDIDDPNGEEHWAGANLTNANKEGN